jgi:hypothetical protein
VWTTCQEYCAGTPYPDAWKRIGESQYYLDPHKRSTSLHNCYQNPLPTWRAEEWYGHVTLQQGHGSTADVSYWLGQYNAAPPRVVIEDEANYELLKYAGMQDNIPGWLARQSAWQSQVAGAAGFTYGGQGIWWACFNRTCTSRLACVIATAYVVVVSSRCAIPLATHPPHAQVDTKQFSVF